MANVSFLSPWDKLGSPLQLKEMQDVAWRGAATPSSPGKALWFCVVVNGCYLPEGEGFYYENCLGNTESNNIKLERLRPLSLSHVRVSRESPR